MAHPLHRVQFWKGTHFEDAWLRHSGVEILCGHGGGPCPAAIGLPAGGGNVAGGGNTAGGGNVHAGVPSAMPELKDCGPGCQAFTEDDEEDENIPYLVEEDEGEFNDEDDNDNPDDESAWLNPTISELPSNGSFTTPGVSHESPLHESRMMVIVDVSGVHELPVVFCRCADTTSEDLQLLDIGYYPASNHRPQTAFTFQVLDHFLLTNKECKTSPQNYFNCLKRISNAGFPHTVPVSDMFEMST